MTEAGRSAAVSGGGRYVVFEGGDGSGKSTQARLLVDRLRDAGRAVEHVREPGSTALGETLREMLLHGHEIDALTEALLFSAARRDLLEKTVRPALARGCCVVAERGFVSTLVYQGWAPERAEDRVSMQLLVQITAAVHRELMPDAVFVLDLPAAVLAARLARREGRDRIEGRGVAWAERVREGFSAVLDARSTAGGPETSGTARRWLDMLLPRERVHPLDAGADIETLHADVVAVARRIGALPPRARSEDR